MTNIYIQQIKNIATAYYEKVCSLRKTIKYNNTTYSRDLADSYNEETEHQIVSEANTAIEKINAVFEEIKSKISILMLLFLKVALLIRKSLIFFYRNIIMIMLLCQFADLFRLIPNLKKQQALSKRQAIMFQLIKNLQSVRSS